MSLLAHADPMIPLGSRILAVTEETRDVFTLELAPPYPEFSFRPGQFNMLYAHGVGEAAISLSGDPGVRDTLLHTVKAVGSVTQVIWRLKVGDTVGIRGPYGRPWPVSDAVGRDLVLVAGGIGLAPLRPVLYEIVRDRGKFGNVTLVYGARTPDDILFSRELVQWETRADMRVIVTVDRAAAGWTGNVGVVPQFLDGVKFDPEAACAMICGPEIMIRFTAVKLAALGMPERDVFISMERNMKCGLGFCGHCQLGPVFVCKDGPVFSLEEMKPWMGVREI